MNKKVLLITGGAGYIGSHAVVEFERQGYQTVIIDNLINSSEASIDGIANILHGYRPDFYETDIRDEKSLRGIFERYTFDGVIHLAGLKAVGESCEKPLEYYDNNVIGSIKLFKLMEEYNVRNIIFSSSATVYTINTPFLHGLGESDSAGMTTNPYASTKYLTEEIIKKLTENSRFRGISLRYFNPIGAHESGFIGENPRAIPNNLMPYVMKVVMGELDTIRIFGSDYPTRDGTGIRDYIDVNDLTRGHVAAWKFLEKMPVSSYELFNLGSGKGTSVLEIIKEAEKVIGHTLPLSFEPRRTGDMPEFYCNPEKARKKLHWEAKINIEESIRNSYNFYAK